MLLRILSPLILVLAISGCASSHMAVKSGPAVSADAGSALVVFMRPSAFGGAIQSSVCRVDDDMHDQEFIGIVSSGTKIGYRARPERHLFMVIAENADFMDAELAPGKTYHVLVSPRIGIWKARFSLLPIHNDPQAKYSLRSERFDNWQASTNFVEKGPTADQGTRKISATSTKNARTTCASGTVAPPRTNRTCFCTSMMACNWLHPVRNA